MREHIIKLQRERAAALDRMKALVAKAEGENRDLTNEEKAAFAKDEAERASLKERIERAEQVEREKAASAVPVEILEGAAPKPTTSGIQVLEKSLKPEVVLGRICAAIAAGRGDRKEAAAWYKRTFESDDVVMAALNATDGGAGAVLIPQTIAPQIAELLLAATVMRKAGVDVMPIVNGRITITRVASGSSFSRVAEGNESNATGPTFGSVTLTAKKILGILPISNDLIQYAPQRIDTMVSNDAKRGVQVAEDADFIRGNGVGATPKGLRYIATVAAGNLLTMTASPDTIKIMGDLARLQTALASANIPMARPAYTLPPRVAVYLQFLQNTQGLRVFPSMDDGKLMGYPFFTTTSIPVNLGGGTETEVYFFDAAECIIGDGEQITVDVSSEASYKDETGTLVSAFSKDQTVVRIKLANDFGMFHDAGVAVLTGVTWGA